MREQLRETVVAAMQTVAEEQGKKLADTIGEETVLLDSGLDSLAFAVLVAQLEEELGYDPFLIMSEPVYPRTLAEFLDVYEQHRPASP